MRPLVSIAVLAGLLNGAPAAAQFDLVALADAEGDGLISKDEFTGFYAMTWLLYTDGKSEVDVAQAPPLVRAMILGVLPEAKGTIDRDRMLDAVPAHYSKADKDQDGVVTLAEMREWEAVAMKAR